MYYVYHLIDPRTDAVFYVGKGKGDRLTHHEAEAKTDSQHPKCAVIRAIWAEGLKVQRRKVRSFDDEQAAYDFEEAEIDRIGLENLTNLVRGGQTARQEAEERAKPFSPLEAVVKLAGHVAYWLIKTDGGKIKSRLVFSGGDPEITKLRNQIAEVTWQKLLPDLWERAIAKAENWPKLTEAFKPYGVDLVFEEAAS